MTWTDSNSLLKLGDSGGANWVEFEGQEFIVGNNVWIDALAPNTTISNASYITGAEFYTVNLLLAGTQSGDVTADEPANLIVGTSGNDDLVLGTFRRDIILGKGEADYISDGDGVGSAVWAGDLLYGGGGGDDVFTAGNGNDLVHGGDYRAYSGATSRTWPIEGDGLDSIDYRSALSRSAGDPGLELRIGSAGSSTLPAWVYGNTTDQNLASYVLDRDTGTAAANQLGVDALISVENVTLSNSDDVLTVNEIASARWAGQDGTGGVAIVDFAGNAAFDGSKQKPGDLVDARNLGPTGHIRVDLAAGIVSAVPGKGPNGQSIPSITVVGAESAYGGAGNDRLTGNAAANRLDGGAGADELSAGNGDDFVVFDTSDAVVDGGAGFDTAILFAGLDQSGNALGATFAADAFRLSNIERLVGTEGDDQISVTNGKYVVNGGAGDDYISVSGRTPVTIEFGRGGGNDFIDGLFQENHDLNGPVLHGVGENPWYEDRQYDTIKLVDLLPSDISLAWHFAERIDQNNGTRHRDGSFAIVINDTGESIQFSELFSDICTNVYGININEDYGPRNRGEIDIFENDPDNYLYSYPSSFDNETRFRVFEFADGSRRSIVELFDLSDATTEPLPASRAKPNQPSLLAQSNSLVLGGSQSDYREVSLADQFASRSSPHGQFHVEATNAQRLALIRQDLAAFGVPSADSIGRTLHPSYEPYQFYA